MCSWCALSSLALAYHCLCCLGAELRLRLQILLGLFGATSSHRTKWGWYGLSCLFLLFVNIGMLWHGEPLALFHGAVSRGCGRLTMAGLQGSSTLTCDRSSASLCCACDVACHLQLTQ